MIVALLINVINKYHLLKKENKKIIGPFIIINKFIIIFIYGKYFYLYTT